MTDCSTCHAQDKCRFMWQERRDQGCRVPIQSLLPYPMYCTKFRRIRRMKRMKI